MMNVSLTPSEMLTVVLALINREQLCYERETRYTSAASVTKHFREERNKATALLDKLRNIEEVPDSNRKLLEAGGMMRSKLDRVYAAAKRWAADDPQGNWLLNKLDPAGTVTTREVLDAWTEAVVNITHDQV